LQPAARGGIPVETRIPASERTSQKLNELLTTGVVDGDARAELRRASRRIRRFGVLSVPPIITARVDAFVATKAGRTP